MENNTTYLRPASAVMTLPDPESMKSSTDVQVGGTMQWRTETHGYPMFHIRFLGPNPFDDEQDKCLMGSDLAPVVVRLKTLGDYEYEIWQMKDERSEPTKDGPHKFSVRSCPGCHP